MGAGLVEVGLVGVEPAGAKPVGVEVAGMEPIGMKSSRVGPVGVRPVRSEQVGPAGPVGAAARRPGEGARVR